jgi:hypothetical protein
MTLRAVGIALALALVIWLVAVQMPTSPAGNSEVVQGFRHPKGFDAFLVRSLSKTPDFFSLSTHNVKVCSCPQSAPSGHWLGILSNLT